MENSIASQVWERLVEFLRIFPILLILVISVYTLNSSARQAIDSFVMSSPAKGLVASNYENYPAFLDEGDVIVKKAFFNDSGTIQEGLIIEIHKPASLAKTQTNSMKPMFGSGNLLVQEEVDASTPLDLGDIIVYENANGELIIHQIVSYKDGCYSTKGLNNAYADEACVTKDMVRFRLLFAIPTK